MHRLLVLIITIASLGTATAENSPTVLTFDDLTSGPDWAFIPNGYGGLQWLGFGVIAGTEYPHSSYFTGMVSPTNVAFNPDYIDRRAYISRGINAFNLESAYLTTGIPDPSIQIEVQGFVNGHLNYDKTYLLSPSAPTLIVFNYLGIDEAVFLPQHVGSTYVGDYLFAMDNLSVSTIAITNFSAATLYVSLQSTNPTPPFTNWLTAATNIQQAVDIALAGAKIIVDNGVYPGGVSLKRPSALQSANGPKFTVIDGGGALQCVSLSDGASLTGFTLSNGFAGGGAGGGVSCASKRVYLTNCVIIGNSAGSGGGAFGGTLYNCALIGNSGDGASASTLYNCALTGNSGGGASASTLYNCTLTGNSSVGVGGGASDCSLNSCIVYFNTASAAANCDANSTLSHCCTIPLPTNGIGNITNNPLFIDYANADLRLQSNSLCINAGNNANVATSTDLDGRPRIVSGTVDIGAYEYQGTGSQISYAWLQQYGLATDGSADFLDLDHDGMNNWQEWLCGTDPTNPHSALRMLSPSITSTIWGTKMILTWQSVAGVNYFLERSANLASPFTLLSTNLVGQAGTTSWTNFPAISAGPFYYRVGVQAP